MCGACPIVGYHGVPSFAVRAQWGAQVSCASRSPDMGGESAVRVLQGTHVPVPCTWCSQSEHWQGRVILGCSRVPPLTVHLLLAGQVLGGEGAAGGQRGARAQRNL